MNITKKELSELAEIYENIQTWYGLGVFNMCQEASEACHDEKDKYIQEYKIMLNKIRKKYKLSEHFTINKETGRIKEK